LDESQSYRLKIARHRFAALIAFALLFLVISTMMRFLLLERAWVDIPHQFFGLARVFLAGLTYDLAAASYACVPFLIYLALVPERLWHTLANRILLVGTLFLSCFLLIFTSVAEWLFWSEFGVRFNFIAVDYLIYTTEVLGNIRESYPLPQILGAIALSSAVTTTILWKFVVRPSAEKDRAFPSVFPKRVLLACAVLIVPLLFTLALNNRSLGGFKNTYEEELAKNGIYSFFAEFRNNELPYEQFYQTLETEEAFKRVRELIATPNSSFTSDNPTDITRSITNSGPEKKWNVMQITVESLSADFLGSFGNTNKLTPNLDRLAGEGLFFENFYATGNRTVRGMEALTLSVPPTPGQSIVRRPFNENLFTLGSVLRSKGYDTSFIYGGFGYFDNMNYYFGENGYKVIDRAAVPKEAITFANAWGACDGDVYNWAIKEADTSYASGKPFHQFIMTTSNHRPFTWPDGKIDLPSKISGREGAVKYTDFAIGEFINNSRSKPWFTNTLFVIVADHCANSAGKTVLPVNEYHIPLIIYQPALVQHQRIGALCSQIDLAPTLLGLMNWSYTSRFYGKDVLKLSPAEERTFIANYQKLGYLTDCGLEVLSPVRQEHFFHCDRSSGSLIPQASDDKVRRDMIAYYQTASHLFRHHLMKAIDAH
jgi:phosphoglycerol transferase MdoB-like AlkP superfamily enzyme